MKLCNLNVVLFLIVSCVIPVFIIGCGGGGGSGGGGDKGKGTPPPFLTDVQVSGKITFDFVPAMPISGLNYSLTYPKASRGVVVEAIKASDSTVLYSTITDSLGNYMVTVPMGTDIKIRVRAQMLKTGFSSWDFQVVDNTNSKALYVMDSAPFNSGIVGIVGKNLHAPSGWDGSTYSSTRVAAPLAILDTVYQAVETIIAADPTATFPQLLINWSVNNISTDGDKTIGQIGTSHYTPSEKELYILGKEDNDTDEYDDHIIAHEWGHYFEVNFSRGDSTGGDHSLGDKLDPRIAFGEGFGNAFSGMATDSPDYIDTVGTSQSASNYTDLEDNFSDTASVGWYSEESVQSILYDLYDGVDEAGVDTISLGFTPIYDVLVNAQKTADSFTTIYSFVAFLKTNYSGNLDVLAGINNLLINESITTAAIDEWDSTGTETNDGGNVKSLPVYSKLTVGAPAVQLCGTGQFGNYNKLMNRRFFYFEITSTGTYSLTAVPDLDGDPFIVFHSMKDNQHISIDSYGYGGTETLSGTFSPGYYVGEVYDYDHVADAYSLEECFDLSLN